MKLKNKQTGRVIQCINECPIDVWYVEDEELIRMCFKSLDKLNTEWEEI